MLNTIVAFSDSHGMQIPEKLLQVIDESKYIFFLGDGVSRLDNILMHKGLHMVKGNCDNARLIDEEVIDIDGVRILLTHGDKYHVKRDLTSLYLRARELDCKVALYGHTHFASTNEYDGVTLICPGSTYQSYGCPPSYLYMVVSNGKFSAKIVKLT